jgi:hypothetical protein
MVFLASKTLLYPLSTWKKTFFSTLNLMILQTVWNECVRFGGHVNIQVSYKICGWKYKKRLWFCTICLAFKRGCSLDSMRPRVFIGCLGVKNDGRWIPTQPKAPAIAKAAETSAHKGAGDDDRHTPYWKIPPSTPCMPWCPLNCT